ncbi:hypothetical protein ACP4OV_024901 [Aristida adscensionis]
MAEGGSGSSRGFPAGFGERLVLDDDDDDVVEVSAAEAAAWWSSDRQKRKRDQSQVSPHEVIELDADADANGSMIIGEQTLDHKNKQAVGFHMDWPKHAKSGVAEDIAGPSAIPAKNVIPLNVLGGYHQNLTSPNAVPATIFHSWDGLGAYHGGTLSPPPWFGLGAYHGGTLAPPPWFGLEAYHGGTLAPPPLFGIGAYHGGTLAPPPWDGLGSYHGGALIPPPWDVQEADDVPTLAPIDYDKFIEAIVAGDNGFIKEGLNNSYKNPLLQSGSNMDGNYYMGIPLGMETVLPLGNMTSAEKPHQPSQTKMVDSKIDENYKAFKQFDMVSDHSDHFYLFPEQGNAQTVKKPSKHYLKRIQHEWKILQKDLPDTIFVRASEDRMDLLRAVIVGPAGTPYHDGLFFFDIHFPCLYPSTPPLVNYRSGGLRINPNLYNCGKVCLSLLNTWPGSAYEKWNPSISTMLQVLVSIQALVLNAKPFFNEPGYTLLANTHRGEKMSMAYNEEAFLLSCRTMIYSLRNPPKHFEDFIIGHFRSYGRKILIGCKAYIDGAQVGCLVGDGVQDVDEGDKSCTEMFKSSLKILFKELLTEFTNIGVDCDEFQNPGIFRANITLRL